MCKLRRCKAQELPTKYVLMHRGQDVLVDIIQICRNLACDYVLL